MHRELFHATRHAYLIFVHTLKKSHDLAAPRGDARGIVPHETLERDELWSFVGFKKNKRWVWLALCRRTRQIVASAVGDRSEATCRLLGLRIPPVYCFGTVYTDFWDAYQKVLPAQPHQAVGKQSGQTNHIERWNNTLRQRVGRFVRKTLSFSKSEEMHEICLRLFLHEYNLDRAKRWQAQGNNST